MPQYKIFDGHNDTLLKLSHPSDFLTGSAGHLDLSRARQGNMLGGFFSIFTPPPPGSPEREPRHGLTFTAQGYDVTPRSPLDLDYARTFTMAAIAKLEQLEAEGQRGSRDNRLAMVHSYRQLQDNFESGVFSIVLHLEGAEAIAPDLSNLQSLYARGLRSLGFVWSRPNAFGTGVPFRFPHSPDIGLGLIAVGKRLVRRCNEMGIVVDLAHINERGFWDVAALSDAPLVVSHAGAHSLCPSTRNLTNRQLDAIAESNGVVGVIFEPLNLRAEGTPDPDASLTEIARHIDYIVARMGIEHVALGSDFDGAQIPADLRDVSQLPNLFEELAQRGYDQESLQKIAHGNWFRVIRDIWFD